MSFDLFEAVLYINLKHRKDRKKQILLELDKLNIKKDKIVRIEAIYTPFNGHAGCVKSHIKALDYAIENKLQNVLILEDDCYFLKDLEFLNYSIFYFFQMVKKWDVFLLGGYFEKTNKSEYPFINRVFSSYRAHAYGINNHYLKTLKANFLETYKNIKDKSYHFDSRYLALDRQWLKLQRKDYWYSFETLLSGQKKDFSDIGWESKKKR